MGALDIGITRQLFFDDLVVARRYRVRKRLHRPQRAFSEPILRAERPWERGGSGVDITGGTVLLDEEDNLFKMWYRTNNAIFERAPEGGFREASADAYRSCYAVSRDGLNWEKPNLSQTLFQGSTKNNILPPGKGGRAFIRRPNLIKDYSDSDHDRRYKMVYLDEVGGEFGLLTAYSADGIRWRMEAERPTQFSRPTIPNGILFGWDPILREYVLYHRNAVMAPADVDGRMVRSDLRKLVRSRSLDFKTWGQTETALALTRRDPNDLDVGHLGILSGFLYTDELYIGFLDTCKVHDAEQVDAELWESFYQMDHRRHCVELAFSRDGRSWHRQSPGWEFFLPGETGAWDSDHVVPAKALVLDDRIWIYYSGSRFSCKSYLPGATSTAEDMPEGEAESYSIGLAFMRVDGFVSYEGYQEAGWLETCPVVFEGNHLCINARAPRHSYSSGSGPRFQFHGDRTVVVPIGESEPDSAPSGEAYGEVRVEIRDFKGRPIPGFRALDCDPFTGDQIEHKVTWQGRADVSALAETPIRLRFFLRNAALYSFGFVVNARKLSRSRRLPCPGCRYPKGERSLR